MNSSLNDDRPTFGDGSGRSSDVYYILIETRDPTGRADERGFRFEVARDENGPDLEDLGKQALERAEEELSAGRIESGIALLETANDLTTGPDAAYRLYKVYFNGEGVERNVPRSFRRLKIAAERGSRDALRTLGLFYQYGGRSVERDPDKAIECYTKAAEEYGDAESFRALGVIYMRGVDAPRDMAKARECFRRGAELGDYLSRFFIAWLDRDENESQSDAAA